MSRDTCEGGVSHEATPISFSLEIIRWAPYMLQKEKGNAPL